MSHSDKGQPDFNELVKRDRQRTLQLTRIKKQLQREIQARTRLQTDLEESRRTMARLLGNLPGMFYRSTYDGQMTMEFVSDGCLALTGYEPSAFTDPPRMRFNDLVLDSYASGRDLVEAALREKRPFQFSYRIRTAAGEEKWVWEQGAGIYSAAGEPVALEGFISDFTVQKHKEQELHRKNKALRTGIYQHRRFGSIVGQSPAMQKVYDLILRAAATDANVLIIGESGTGKELAARAIHDAGERAPHPFVAVNCGAVPENLIETEFFGHAKGAFTGAHTDRRGYLHRAHGGTLFLDEVGDISLSMQAKLLRALEDGSYLPVGDNRPRRSDLRVVAATNRDPYEMMRTKQMRLDFFYRISVVPITLPPLRDRREDIPLLADYFLERSGRTREDLPLVGQEMDILQHHPWPGNVRELQNVIQRFLTVQSLDFLQAPGAPAGSCAVVSGEPAPDLTVPGAAHLATVEKKMIADTLARVCWNRTKAAEILGISRRVLYGRIKKYGIQ